MKVLRAFSTTARRFAAGVELAPGDVPEAEIPALIKAGYLPKPSTPKPAVAANTEPAETAS
jgi:hypothetical protein